MHDLIVRDLQDFRQNGLVPLPAAFAWDKTVYVPTTLHKSINTPFVACCCRHNLSWNRALGHSQLNDSEQTSSVHFVLKPIFKLTHAGARMAEGLPAGVLSTIRPL